MGSQGEGHGPRETHHPRLARGVVHAAGVAAHRGRRDIDDGPRPAGRDERARHRLRAEEAALQVDAEHVVPLALRQFEE